MICEWARKEVIFFYYGLKFSTPAATMTGNELLSPITTNPKVMVGKLVIKETRLTVEYILNLLAHGATVEEILKEYEGLVEADIQSCLLFTSHYAR